MLRTSRFRLAGLALVAVLLAAVGLLDRTGLLPANLGSMVGRSLSGTTMAAGDPDAVSRADGRIDLVVRGSDGQVWYANLANSAWSEWTKLGSLENGPALAKWGSGLELYAKDADTTLQYRSYKDGAWRTAGPA